MNQISSIIRRLGPSRSSKIASELEKLAGISNVTARQRVSRASGDIKKFPIPLLPNKEAFVYLLEQRTTEDFWINFLGALRDTNSIYGYSIDSLIAKGGIISKREFAVISGAPILMKGQVSHQRVYTTLETAGVLKTEIIDGLECVVISRSELCSPDYAGFRPKLIAEDVILDGFHDWARKTGFGSFNKIVTRKFELEKRRVGPCAWDLTAPSYLLPLKGDKSKPGFLVADVFSDGRLGENEIGYIIRKVHLLKASLRHSRILPVLIGESFSGEAITKGRSEGILLITPELLFGSAVARGLKNLIETLKNAAGIAAANPDRIVKLIEQLKDIEGSASNLRGILFELICAYIAKVLGGTIEFAIKAKDAATGKEADIDVLRIPHKGECIAIECKGKNPGGIVNVEEVEDWVKRFPVFTSHLRSDPRYKDSNLRYEIWTSGSFSDDALELLKKEKIARKKIPIDWKDGNAVFSISNTAKEKRINDALKEHFIKHPLN